MCLRRLSDVCRRQREGRSETAPTPAHGSESEGLQKRGAIFCRKNDEFCRKNDELCIKNDEFCIKTDEFCIKTDEFCRSGRIISPRPS